MSKPKFPKDFGKVSSKKADVFGNKFESLAHHAEDRPDLPSEWGTTEPLQAAPEAQTAPIPRRHESEYWRGTTSTYTRQLIEELGRAEATIAELVGALQSLVDSIEDAGAHDENGDVFDITEACAALARAKEASR